MAIPGRLPRHLEEPPPPAPRVVERPPKPSLIDRVKGMGSSKLDAARARSPLFDHVARTYGHYKDGAGDREAAALTYQGFLAVFPIVLLVTAVFGYLIRDESEVKARVLSGAGRAIPGSASMLAESLDAISAKAGTIGAIALVGLVWTALGVISTIRSALDRTFGVESQGGLKGKLRDLRFAGALGGLLLVSVVMASLSAGAMNAIMKAIGIEGPVLRAGGVALAFALTFLADFLLFLVLFTVLPSHTFGWRDTRSAAFVAAIGWTLLKTVGGWYIATSASRASAAYGVTATILGLLLAINLSTRLTLFSAHWAAARCREKCPT